MEFGRVVRVGAALAALAPATAGVAQAQNAGRPSATSYSYNFAPAGDIREGERRVISTPQGTMVCYGGNNRPYRGTGMPRGNSSRSCVWTNSR